MQLRNVRYTCDIPTDKGLQMKTVFTHGGANTFKGAKTKSHIQVDQQESGKKLFTVTYGLAQKKGLSYTQAAHKLGEVLFHHLACESALDNDGE